MELGKTETYTVVGWFAVHCIEPVVEKNEKFQTAVIFLIKDERKIRCIN